MVQGQITDSCHLVKLILNSKYDDFGAIPYNDYLYFVSNRKPDALFSENRYTDIYKARLINDTTFEKPQRPSKLNTRFNNGPISFSKKGEVFFSANRNPSYNSKSVNYLVLFTSAFVNQKFTKWAELDLGLKARNNYTHPAINSNADILVFASDMPGGFGGTDLYICYKIKGIWSAARNLGENINTKGNEISPFLHPDGSLYFASNGLNGIGGYDIFITFFINDFWEIPRNLKFPYNSTADDYFYYCSNDKSTGYLTSNREGTKSNRDIYYFFIKKPTQ